MYYLKSIDPLRSSAAHLEKLHECTMTIWAEQDGKNMTFEDFSEASKDIKRDTYVFDIFLLYKDQEVIGRLTFQIVQEHDDQDVSIAILNDHLNKYLNNS